MNDISLLHIALFYLVIINVVTFFMYGIDKWKAKKSKWRIRETGYYLVAEIVNILCDEKYLAEDGKPDVEKMELITFDPVHHTYIQLGKTVGNAFSDGKQLK